MEPRPNSDSLASGIDHYVEPMQLHPIAGPPTREIEVRAGEPVTVGRSTACTVELADAAVSRRHLTIESSRGRWVITDEGSRHGTLINGIAIEKASPTPIEHGDTIAIGPWIFRVFTSGNHDSTLATMDDRAQRQRSVHVVAPTRLGSLAQRRLMLLMETAAAIQDVDDENELAKTALPMLREGTGFGRAALVRTVDTSGQIEIIGTDQDEGSSELLVSRSLIDAACHGELVELESESDLAQAVSIVGQGVSSAMCAPVQVGATIVAFLYLDVTNTAQPVEPDAAAYVAAVAKLCGLAMANLSRRSLERRQAEMMRELHAAQQVQRRMMPDEHGTFGAYQFAMNAQPGRIVAGDVFGITPMAGGATAVFIGDVTSKGLGPAMIMAAIQSYVAAALSRSSAPDPTQVVAELNTHICAHTSDLEFSSLWFALFDADGQLSVVDAGHGYALVVRAATGPETRKWQGGLLVGVDPGATYQAETITLAPGDRVVLVSDGIVEQRDGGGEEFGVDRTIAVLRDTKTPSEDTTALFDALRTFAGGDVFDDDVTVASIERVS